MHFKKFSLPSSLLSSCAKQILHMLQDLIFLRSSWLVSILFLWISQLFIPRSTDKCDRCLRLFPLALVFKNICPLNSRLLITYLGSVEVHSCMLVEWEKTVPGSCSRAPLLLLPLGNFFVLKCFLTAVLEVCPVHGLGNSAHTLMIFAEKGRRLSWSHKMAIRSRSRLVIKKSKVMTLLLLLYHPHSHPDHPSLDKKGSTHIAFLTL